MKITYTSYNMFHTIVRMQYKQTVTKPQIPADTLVSELQITIIR